MLLDIQDKQSKLRIAMYCGFPPPLTGQTLSNRILSNYLQEKGYSIKKYNTAVKFDQIGAIRLKKIIDALMLACSFNKNSKNIDVVYATMYQTKNGFLKFFPMFKICKRKKIPYIIHLHGNLLHRTFSKSGRLLQKAIINVLNRSSGIILLTELLSQQELFQALSAETYVVNNCVEPEYFVTFEEKKPVMSNTCPFRLLYLSNLLKTKGILDVLRATLILKEKGLDFKLTIAGMWEKSVRKRGQELVKKIGEHVEYLGFVDGEQKRSLILQSHVFLLPTYYPQEGIPISILEAMAGGNVIITTRHSGIPDIVNEGENGLFVEKQNPHDIARKIEQLYNASDLLCKISQNNIDYSNRFTVEKFGLAIERILSNAYKRNQNVLASTGGIK